MTGDVLPWLPDRHLGVASTLAHADDLIAQVGELLFDYMTQPDGVIELKEVMRGSCSETTVVGLAPIARKIPLLAADALLALRAAIEHTLFAEAEFLSGTALDEKAARTIEMPAALSYGKYAEWVKNRQRNAPAAMAKSSELLRRVEGLQPFHRNIRPELHPMARLALHTNHAKHRTPAVTAVRLVTIVRDDEVPLSRHDVKLEPEVPLRVGDVIARTPLGQHVPVALFPTVGVNRPGTDQWPILMHELADLASWVREQAVPRLITGEDPPPERIPARYEITAAHADERGAIAQGSLITAAERTKLKLGATSARRSLVDLLLPLTEGLSRDGLELWLENASDAEVVDWASQLKESLLDGPTKTEEILDRLIDDASRHLDPGPGRSEAG